MPRSRSAGTTSTLRFSKASALLALLLLLPGVAAQGSHGLSDHHAFLAGRNDVPAGTSFPIQINHTYFAWATIWYSARVEAGPPIRTFMVDGENLSRFLEGGPFASLEGTEDGPTTAAGGTAAAIPRGVYHLVLQSAEAGGATVKWEVFLEPRFPGSGEPGGTTGAAPAPLLGGILLPLLLGVGLGGGVAAAWILRRR